MKEPEDESIERRAQKREGEDAAPAIFTIIRAGSRPAKQQRDSKGYGRDHAAHHKHQSIDGGTHLPSPRCRCGHTLLPFTHLKFPRNQTKRIRHSIAGCPPISSESGMFAISPHFALTWERAP